MNVISFAHVSKRFQAASVLHELTFAVAQGESVLLVGKNGSGKSTLLKLCADLLRPSAGEIARDKSLTVGLATQALLAYEGLTVQENLELYSRGGEVATLVRDLELTPLLTKLLSVLSRGELTRVQLALAACRKPELLLLDEPTIGLDAHALRLVLHFVRNERAARKTRGGLIIASHDVVSFTSEVDRIVLLDSGKIISSVPAANVSGVLSLIARYQGAASGEQLGGAL